LPIAGSYRHFGITFVVLAVLATMYVPFGGIEELNRVGGWTFAFTAPVVATWLILFGVYFFQRSLEADLSQYVRGILVVSVVTALIVGGGFVGMWAWLPLIARK
jgi:hypothetical protein